MPFAIVQKYFLENDPKNQKVHGIASGDRLIPLEEWNICAGIVLEDTHKVLASVGQFDKCTSWQNVFSLFDPPILWRYNAHLLFTQVRHITATCHDVLIKKKFINKAKYVIIWNMPCACYFNEINWLFYGCSSWTIKHLFRQLVQVV